MSLILDDDAFAAVRQELTRPIKVDWYDEHASGVRDVLLLLAGTLFGTAGAGAIEFNRRLWA